VLDSTLAIAPGLSPREWCCTAHGGGPRLATLRDQAAGRSDVSTEVVDGYPDSGLVDAAKKLGAS
jgi:hypothetical protein